MRSELRDKVADLLMGAIHYRERSILLFWLRAYCQMVKECDAPAVPFSRLAQFVGRHKREIGWCGGSGEAWGHKLIADSGLFRVGKVEEVAIAQEYRKDLSLICTQATVYWGLLKDLHRRPYNDGLVGVLQQAALLWQHRLFFEFHEILEDAWMDWRGPERRFLQGLIQLGVGFYHIQRNNYRGAMSMFRNGWDKVAPHAPRYCGVEIRKFLGRVEKCRGHLEELGPGRCHHFDWSRVPQMEVAGSGRLLVGTRKPSTVRGRQSASRS
ncbi:MAG: DUF309 domain-containing protein [candidate division NC10 bacterium]